MNEDLLIAWAAGFLDGEGHFGVSITRRRIQVSVQASQTSPEPLVRLQETFGGSVRSVRPSAGVRSEVWTWGAWGATAYRDIVPRLLPYLTVKRDRASEVLKLAQLTKPRGTAPYTQEEKAKRNALLLSIMGRVAPLG